MVGEYYARTQPTRYQLSAEAFSFQHADQYPMEQYRGSYQSIKSPPMKSHNMKSPMAAQSHRGGFKAPATPKHHVLLCEKHVTCGSCPYEGKCKYIHDRGVASVCKFVNRPCKPDKDNSKFEARDSFFWPNSLPIQGSSSDEYVLSAMCDPKFYLRHRAVFSMWNHFKHFCADGNTNTVSPSAVNDPSNPINTFTSTKRLDIFMTLSAGKFPREEAAQRTQSVPISTPCSISSSATPVEEQVDLSSSPSSVSMFACVAAANSALNQQMVYEKVAERYSVASPKPSLLTNSVAKLRINSALPSGLAAGSIDYQSPNFMSRKQFVF